MFHSWYTYFNIFSMFCSNRKMFLKYKNNHISSLCLFFKYFISILGEMGVQAHAYNRGKMCIKSKGLLCVLSILFPKSSSNKSLCHLTIMNFNRTSHTSINRKQIENIYKSERIWDTILVFLHLYQYYA